MDERTAHEFNPRAPLADLAAALAVAERCASAAGLAAALELRVEPSSSAGPALLVGGPDGFGFFGTTAFRWVRVPFPCSARSVAIAVARHALGEYWASDDEIAAEHAKLPLALCLALGAGVDP